MMKAIISKVNDDNYFKPLIINIEILKKLIDLKSEILLTVNDWKNEDVEKIMRYWHITDIGIAEWISKADYEIMIYEYPIE